MRPRRIKQSITYSLLTREGPEDDGLIHLIKTENLTGNAAYSIPAYSPSGRIGERCRGPSLAMG
jgi:hypothetical protein